MNMGCDPEFFFRNKDGIIGAEKILPAAGLVAGEGSKFIIDGVQAELNPRPSTCRALLANEISRCFRSLDAELKKKGNVGITADFNRAIEISKESLMELDEKARMFGCAPSKSIYRTKSSVNIAKVDPMEYRVRAAGGHIHIGKSNNTRLTAVIDKDHKRVVQMLDLLCGNTAVLVDRDPANIERRKVYGRAGEFRLPAHGLEYRTLSNFWLTSYQLMSFAFGMARFAVEVMADTNADEFFDAFTSKVKKRNVHNAINNNDFELAMENFQAIEKLICQYVARDTDGRYAITSANLAAFHHFVKRIDEQGLQYWFKEEPMKHWMKIGDAHDNGFFDWTQNVVRMDMAKAPKVAKAAA